MYNTLKTAGMAWLLFSGGAMSQVLPGQPTRSPFSPYPSLSPTTPHPTLGTLLPSASPTSWAPSWVPSLPWTNNPTSFAPTTIPQSIPDASGWSAWDIFQTSMLGFIIIGTVIDQFRQSKANKARFKAEESKIPLSGTVLKERDAVLNRQLLGIILNILDSGLPYLPSVNAKNLEEIEIARRNLKFLNRENLVLGMPAEDFDTATEARIAQVYNTYVTPLSRAAQGNNHALIAVTELAAHELNYFAWYAEHLGAPKLVKKLAAILCLFDFIDYEQFQKISHGHYNKGCPFQITIDVLQKPCGPFVYDQVQSALEGRQDQSPLEPSNKWVKGAINCTYYITLFLCLISSVPAGFNGMVGGLNTVDMLPEQTRLNWGLQGNETLSNGEVRLVAAQLISGLSSLLPFAASFGVAFYQTLSAAKTSAMRAAARREQHPDEARLSLRDLTKIKLRSVLKCVLSVYWAISSAVFTKGNVTKNAVRVSDGFSHLVGGPAEPLTSPAAISDTALAVAGANMGSNVALGLPQYDDGELFIQLANSLRIAQSKPATMWLVARNLLYSASPILLYYGIPEEDWVKYVFSIPTSFGMQAWAAKASAKLSVWDSLYWAYPGRGLKAAFRCDSFSMRPALMALFTLMRDFALGSSAASAFAAFTERFMQEVVGVTAIDSFYWAYYLVLIPIMLASLRTMFSVYSSNLFGVRGYIHNLKMTIKTKTSSEWDALAPLVANIDRLYEDGDSSSSSDFDDSNLPELASAGINIQELQKPLLPRQPKDLAYYSSHRQYFGGQPQDNRRARRAAGDFNGGYLLPIQGNAAGSINADVVDLFDVSDESSDLP